MTWKAGSNTEMMRLSSTGNLGIGTSSPSYKLVAIDGTNAKQQIVFSDNATYFGSISHNSGTGQNEYRTEASGAHGWFIGTSSTTANMTLDSSGNLGLGATTLNLLGGTRCITLNAPTGGNYSSIELATGGTLQGFLSSNNGSTSLGTNTSTPLLFQINATERARISSGGDFLINTTTASTNALFEVSSNGTKKSFQVYNNDNVQLYSLGTGTVTCSSGVLSYTSDERLKIADGVFSGGLEAVQNIIPQYFYWKGEDGQQDPNRPRELGFFAQNIQATCGEETAPNPHREDLHMGIHDRGVMAVLVSAIQEQQALITQLTTRLTALESK